jgi:hypothetical protein
VLTAIGSESADHVKIIAWLVSIVALIRFLAKRAMPADGAGGGRCPGLRQEARCKMLILTGVLCR